MAILNNFSLAAKKESTHDNCDFYDSLGQYCQTKNGQLTLPWH